MSPNLSKTNQASPVEHAQTTGQPPVPKRITNAQTVCSEKNEKGKLCNGHLKQLRTAGEAAEVHLRGDDVLFKCQICGTLYMGPPLGHVRDPEKQRRFVEAELAALLQAAGGTLPVVRKNERGVYVLVEAGGEHGHAAAKPAAPAVQKTAAAPSGTVAPPGPQKSVTQPSAPAPAKKAGAEPNRQLMKRSTYSGVADTGPVAGESFDEKVARLRAVAAAAKQRAEEAGAEAPTHAAEPAVEVGLTEAPPPSSPAPTEVPTPATAAAPVAPSHSGQADRTLFRRSTYCGVIDTGPVAGETFEQKVERLRALSAAAKQRSEESGSA